MSATTPNIAAQGGADVPVPPAGTANQGEADAKGGAPARRPLADLDPEMAGAVAGSDAKRARVEGWGTEAGGGQASPPAGGAASLHGGCRAPPRGPMAPRQRVSLTRGALVVARSVPLARPSNSGLHAALVCGYDVCRHRERVAVMRACRQACSSGHCLDLCGFFACGIY